MVHMYIWQVLMDIFLSPDTNGLRDLLTLFSLLSAFTTGSLQDKNKS